MCVRVWVCQGVVLHFPQHAVSPFACAYTHVYFPQFTVIEVRVHTGRPISIQKQLLFYNSSMLFTL